MHITIIFFYLVDITLMDIQKARKAERGNMMLKHLTHTMWPLQICYVPKYVQINTSL